MNEIKLGNGFVKVHFLISTNLVIFLKIEGIYDVFIKESINTKNPIDNKELIRNVDESFCFRESKFKDEDFWYDMFDKWNIWKNN